MTYYKPCLNCAADKKLCERRNAIRRGMKGLGVSSVNFRCDDREPRFHRGQRVSFVWNHYENNEIYSERFLETFYGTIMHEKSGHRRFVIKVDQSSEYYDIEPKYVLKSPEFISVRPDDITPLDEPDRRLCPNCSAEPEDVPRLCWNDAILPDGCFSR